MIKVASISEINELYVKLKLNSDSNCKDCKSRCSDGFLGFLFHKKNKADLLVAKQDCKDKIQIVDEDGFFNSNRSVGDTVGISFSDKNLMILSVLLYATPIFLILLFLPVAYVIGPMININADLSGLLGFGFALVLSKVLIHQLRSKLKFKVNFFE